MKMKQNICVLVSVFFFIGSNAMEEQRALSSAVAQENRDLTRIIAAARQEKSQILLDIEDCTESIAAACCQRKYFLGCTIGSAAIGVAAVIVNVTANIQPDSFWDFGTKASIGAGLMSWPIYLIHAYSGSLEKSYKERERLQRVLGTLDQLLDE